MSNNHYVEYKKELKNYLIYLFYNNQGNTERYRYFERELLLYETRKSN
jgi:hypothetical protein